MASPTAQRLPAPLPKYATLLVVLLGLVGVHSTAVAAEVATAEAASSPKTFVHWQQTAVSPQPVRAVTTRDRVLYQLCGQPDLALVRAAASVVDRQLDGLQPYTAAELKQVTRAAGAPQAWPRAWSVTNLDDPAKLSRRLQRWLSRQATVGVRRCGIARGVDQQSRSVLAVVTVDAIADLRPLANRIRLAQWVSFEGVMRTAAQGVTVMLLGPRGRPRRILSSLSGGRIRSRFSLDQPGTWLVQVLATLPSGPQPVLEVPLFVQQAPPTELFANAVPGEPTALPPGAAGVFAMLQAARRAEGVAPLRLDARLDRVALVHARAMLRSHTVAHDLGRGTADQRVTASGCKATVVGENVAAATSELRAHRVLWASPSHRQNMLFGGYRRVGVAAVNDGKGMWWVVQVYTD